MVVHFVEEEERRDELGCSQRAPMELLKLR